MGRNLAAGVHLCIVSNAVTMADEISTYEALAASELSEDPWEVRLWETAPGSQRYGRVASSRPF